MMTICVHKMQAIAMYLDEKGCAVAVGRCSDCGYKEEIIVVSDDSDCAAWLVETFDREGAV